MELLLNLIKWEEGNVSGLSVLMSLNRVILFFEARWSIGLRKAKTEQKQKHSTTNKMNPPMLQYSSSTVVPLVASLVHSALSNLTLVDLLPTPSSAWSFQGGKTQGNAATEMAQQLAHQRMQFQVQVPRWLTAVCNSSLRASDSLFWLLSTSGKYMACKHTFKQSTHTQK